MRFFLFRPGARRRERERERETIIEYAELRFSTYSPVCGVPFFSGARRRGRSLRGAARRGHPGRAAWRG